MTVHDNDGSLNGAHRLGAKCTTQIAPGIASHCVTHQPLQEGAGNNEDKIADTIKLVVIMKSYKVRRGSQTCSLPILFAGKSISEHHEQAHFHRFGNVTIYIG